MRQTIAFGPYQLDPQSRRLTRDGAELVLGGRAFDVLATLAATPGETVSKDTLLATVWPNLIVEENNLQVHILALRKLLGEGWIVTVPGRGYRLLAAPPSATPTAPAVPEAPALPDLPSIAVLPFANLGGDPEQEFFSDGIAEDILTDLSRDRRLFVIGRGSSFTYRAAAVDLRQVGRDLGVRYVLDGSVRRAADRLRITARLNDAITGASIWSERYDRDTADIFAVQDQITDAVAAAIRPAVADAEQSRARRKRPDSLTAWEAYQRGLWHLARYSEVDADAAVGFMRQAIALDPQFGAAHVGLCAAIFRLMNLARISFAECARQCLELSRKALDCDPDDVEALVGCSASLRFLGDIEGSGHLLDEAARRFPNSHFVLRQRAARQIALGAFAEGRANTLAYLRTNPRDPMRDIYVSNIAFSHYQERNYATAAELARETIASAPEKTWPYRLLPAALGQLGRTEEARVALDSALTHSPKVFAAYVNERPPFYRPEDQEHILEGLRKAGWTPKPTPP